MTIQMDSGEKFIIRAGDVFHFGPGHDAWVEGDQKCVLLDMGGYSSYAKEKAA